MAYAGEQLNKGFLDLHSGEERNNSKKMAVLSFYPPTKEHLLICMVFITVHAKTSKCEEIQLCKRVRFNLSHRKNKSLLAPSVQH